RCPVAALTWSAQPWIALGAPRRAMRQLEVPGRRFSTATQLPAGPAGAAGAAGGVEPAGGTGPARRSWDQTTSTAPAAARTARAAATVVAALCRRMATLTSSDRTRGPNLPARSFRIWADCMPVPACSGKLPDQAGEDGTRLVWRWGGVAR